MTDRPIGSPSDAEVFSLLGRIDERTAAQAQNAIETRNAIAGLNAELSKLDAKFATRRELNLMKWVLGIVAGLAVSGALLLFARALGNG